MSPEALHPSTDDIIAYVLPLFRRVLAVHEMGFVIPWDRENVFFVSGGALDLDTDMAHPPLLAPFVLQGLFPGDDPAPLEIVNPSEPSAQAAYRPGYVCFEATLGHHDPQTDLFSLGLLLASAAFDLDLRKPDDLSLFLQARVNPQAYNSRLHPTVCRLITEMTELDRSRRSQDLYEVISTLEHYRDFDPERQTDLSLIPGWLLKEPKMREGIILNKLRNRLFDLSRRNRLLFYKPNLRLVNLTAGSIPLVLHHQSIRPELLFTWHEELAQKMIDGNDILLNKYLRFEDFPSLPGLLDRVRVEARHDVQEYGFSELKLVIAFLAWHNLRDEPEERIQSPLLLLPVSLKKVKKVREDHYVLKVLDNAAEVNPVLAGQLRELYGIVLPDFIDLEEMNPEQFCGLVKRQIEEVRQGIGLQYIDKPRIRIIQEPAAPTPAEPAETEPKPETERGPDIAHPARPTSLPKERFELAQDPGDPHSWDFDVCQMVLGNFHYKKMSLVRDYNTVIDRAQPHPSFDALFSEQPRNWPEQLFDGNIPDNWFHVVPADPAQTSAILQSRSGHSYIIQGPPGTGKSQTITNLIADFVARGKTVLFVCEKRAALDVVYHRLKQVGLEELCCYIHDSQGDKREFVKNLKATYEDFVAQKMDLAALKQQRERLLQEMNRDLALLRDFHDIGSSEENSTGLPVRELTERLIALRNELTPLTAAEEELLPSYTDWLTAAPTITDLETLLEETEPGAAFSDHPYSRIRETIFNSLNPHRLLETSLQEAFKALDETEALLRSSSLDPQLRQDMHRVKSLVQFSVLLYPLAAAGHMALADPASAAAKQWEQQLRGYRELEESYRLAQQKNSHWLQKPEERDLDAALALAVKHEHAFLGRLNSGWRKAKQYIDRNYDFAAHTLRPSYRYLLEDLKTEYTAATEVEQTRRSLEDHYRWGQSLDTAALSIDMLQHRKGQPDLDYLVQHPDGPALVTTLQALHQPLNTLESSLGRCLETAPDDRFTVVRDELSNIQLNLDGLPEWLPALRAFAALPVAVKTALRRLPLRQQKMQAAIIRKTLTQVYQTHRSYATTEGHALERSVGQLDISYAALQEINARLIRAFVRQKFLHQFELSNRPASQLTDEQKRLKKIYAEGRKILENEFGKSMRYKSIRELSEKESGEVLKTLKPVWLMSPYSVSDSLPLDDEHFDVVIYDEASQITLEEGVPALYRSRQTIIVGDEKQMPPTDFFGSGPMDKDPDDLGSTDTPDNEYFTIDADSLLAQGARKLESRLLSWHYRSHYETLISFSNYAFYGGELLTIPDKTIHHHEKTQMRIDRPEEARLHADSLFDRSISFHHLPASNYSRRTNPDEAAYIAQLVRELLRRRVSESIGIVAFSQEQQRAIGNALDRLAAQDAGFSQLLEEAYNRTANDQFVGLIIKNLENIQGDERDIILISVCYGPDSQRRMVMNFGPVNKKGGEKRLNVLFSRARKHMAVVSSIRYEQITNEYNEGANYLRRFLQYAELVSTGHMTAARTILESVAPPENGKNVETTSTVMREQIRKELTALGYEVGGPIGESDFKCSLAVKRSPQDPAYALAILIDDEEHYRSGNLVEQYYQRPAILREFGWKVLPVYAKDWLHQPKRVMEQIVALLEPGTAPQTPETLTEPVGTTGSTATHYNHLDFHRLTHPADKTFWEAATEGNKLIVRWGRAGARVQIRLRSFADETAAGIELGRLEEEQKQKGYLSDQEPR